MTNSKKRVGRPVNTANEKLAEDFGVSKRRLQQIISQYGLDKITDIKELQLLEKRASIALRTLRAEREKHDLEVARRDVIPKAEAYDYGVALGEIANQLCTEALINWPTQLAGKGELQIREALGHILDEFVEQLREKAKQL